MTINDCSQKRHKVDEIRLPPLSVIEQFPQVPAQAGHRLGSIPTSMDRKLAPRFDRIQHRRVNLKQ